MTTTRLYTAEDLLAMGEDAPYILIEGRLVEEMPCGNKSSELGVKIAAHLLIHSGWGRLGRVYGADGGFILQRHPDTVVAPDAAFIRTDRLPPPDELGNGFVPAPPDLAVEVLSPGNSAGETARKVELYQRAGVPLIWVLDPVRKSAVVHARGQESVSLAVGDSLDGGEVLPGFRLPLADLFA